MYDSLSISSMHIDAVVGADDGQSLGGGWWGEVGGAGKKVLGGGGGFQFCALGQYANSPVR